MRRFLGFLLLIVVGCSTAAVETTTTAVVAPTTSSTTTTIATTSTTERPAECPAAPYELAFLPDGVGQGLLNPDDIEPDVWTSVGGTHTTFWGRVGDELAMALVRGTLPAVDWPGAKQEIDIDGTPGVVGPHPDGTWVAGWFEEPGERCDLYTVVFYPPWAPPDVEQVLEGMNRVGG
jgi:hypothetical protein